MKARKSQKANLNLTEKYRQQFRMAD